MWGRRVHKKRMHPVHRSQACQVQRVFLRPGTHSLLLRRHGLDVRNTEGAERMPQAWRELRPGIGGDKLRGLVASLARLPTKATWERQDNLRTA